MADDALTIAFHWSSYRAKCVPFEASRAQIQATETAFYGGAMIVLELILALGELDDEEAEVRLEALRTEADRYLTAMEARIRGRHH